MRSREKLPGPPKAEEVRSGKVEGNLETESEVGFYKKVRQEVFLSNASEGLRTEENDVESHSRIFLAKCRTLSNSRMCWESPRQEAFEKGRRLDSGQATFLSSSSRRPRRYR